MTADVKDFRGKWVLCDVTMQVEVWRGSGSPGLMVRTLGDDNVVTGYLNGAIVADEHTTIIPVRPELPTTPGSGAWYQYEGSEMECRLFADGRWIDTDLGECDTNWLARIVTRVEAVTP